MMDFKEIEKIAYLNNPLPTAYPSQAEQLAYLSMRVLYNDYRKNNIGKSQAQSEREKIKQAYESANADYQRNLKLMKEINDIRITLAGMSKLVETGTCDRCKQMMRIFDGRMK